MGFNLRASYLIYLWNNNGVLIPNWWKNLSSTYLLELQSCQRQLTPEVNNSGLTTKISISKKHHWSKLSELWIERKNCIKDTTRGVPSKIWSIFLAFQHQVVNPKFQYLTQGLLYFWLLHWQLWQSNWYVDSHAKNLTNLLCWKLHNPSHSHLHCKYILCNF